MSNKQRKEFTDAQIENTLHYNWHYQVLRQWPHDFSLGQSPHYICESCRYVSPLRGDFEVDHIVNCEYGSDCNLRPQLQPATAPTDRDRAALGTL